MRPLKIGISGVRGIVGETPNLAARLQDVAEPNMVIIADGTRRLLGNLFELRDFGVTHRIRLVARSLLDPAPPDDFLAGVVDAAQRLRCRAQRRVRRDHLRDREARAQALAELAERPVGHARHRRDGEVVRDGGEFHVHRVASVQPAADV